MKRARLIAIAALVAWLALSGPAFAADPRPAKAKAAKSGGAKKKKELSTDVRFDGTTVHGKYQFADEAVAAVEDEKTLDDLLGVRKHFKDRLGRESTRR